ncbi:hypothetical protein RUM43_007517 [Polyplax serrata]|uniref:Uncharacterized protein n=1 Tax=Polyplax serrata TaxID=468196 RepID=A0AAN8PMQ5_POLSC
MIVILPVPSIIPVLDALAPYILYKFFSKCTSELVECNARAYNTGTLGEKDWFIGSITTGFSSVLPLQKANVEFKQMANDSVQCGLV